MLVRSSELVLGSCKIVDCFNPETFVLVLVQDKEKSFLDIFIKRGRAGATASQAMRAP